MALQGDSPGQLQELFGVLRRRKWQVMLPIAYCLSIGIAFAAVVPKKYKVKTQVELRQLVIPGSGGPGGGSVSTIEADNAPAQISSLQRIRGVLDKLRWTDYLSLSTEEQNEFLERIQKDLAIVVPRREGNKGSTFVTIEYLDADPARAYELLLELRDAWRKQVVERDRDRIRLEYDNLRARQGDELKLYQKLQRDLASLKASHDLSPTQPSPGRNQTREEDPSYARLSDRLEQLEEAELELQQADDLVVELEKALAEIPDRVPKTETVEGQSFADQIAELTVERAELVRIRDESGYRPAHSRYKEIQRQLEEIDNAIADLESLVTEDEESVTFEPNPDYQDMSKELTAARLDAAKARQRRDSLNSFILRDRELAQVRQEVYRQEGELSQQLLESELKLQELAVRIQEKRIQMDFVGGEAGNPFVITQEPVPPRRPSKPNPFLILAFALVAGAALGFGSALGLEFSKSSFRGAGDVARTMAVPVLGVVGEIVTRVQARRTRVRRTVVGVVSALFCVTMIWLAYGWAVDPDLLTPGVRSGIEGFRELLM